MIEYSKMSNELKDILSNLNSNVEQEKLLQYLNKSLSPAESHELEKQLMNDDFANDAMEGLEQVTDKASIRKQLDELNLNLLKQVSKRKARKEKRAIPSQYWTYIAISLLLILLVAAYFVIRNLRN